MEILFWIIAIIAIYFIYAYFSGYQRQLNYQRAIADLMQELATNPHQFFAPNFIIHPIFLLTKMNSMNL